MSRQVFEIPVMDTINVSWTKTYGAKGTIWTSIAILFIIMFTIGALEGMSEGSLIASTTLRIIGNALGYFLQLGLIYMGITRAKDLPINYKMIFTAFSLQLILRLVGLYILQTLIFLIPVVLGAVGFFLYSSNGALAMAVGSILSIAGIALLVIIAVRLSLSVAFVLDTNLAPLESIKKSIAATEGNVLNLIGIFILQLLIILLSMIPLGVGLIWSIPFALICYGVIYKELRVNA
jgi:hypothetical protein